jgi:hypothetical protein
MGRDTDHLAGRFDAADTGGLLNGILADEDVLDRRALWRIGSWGAGAVGSVILAVLASQSSMALRREQVAAADLQQVRSVARENQSEARRLASAIDTLNGDRDRLYSRVTVLEQGLDSVTGAIARQSVTAAAPQAAATSPASPAATTSEPQSAAPTTAPTPLVSAVATTTVKPSAKAAEKPPPEATVAAQDPATISPVENGGSSAPAARPTTSLVAAKSLMAPPDAAAAKLIEPETPAKAVIAAPIPEVVAYASPADEAGSDAPQAVSSGVAVRRTDFGVDVGGANSLAGLRALWRGLLKSRSNAALTALQPIIVIKEGRNGLGIQLRLVAGPLSDAAAAAKICATLIENERTCETTVFDGQHLAMTADEPAAAAKPVLAKPSANRRSVPRRGVSFEPAKKPESVSTLSSLFGRR